MAATAVPPLCGLLLPSGIRKGGKEGGGGGGLRPSGGGGGVNDIGTLVWRS